ncbi:MAG TPA: hypothetical protein VGO11_15920, partial [Chthoniobacteraceae bacterium]|nr:hypothetical protein [Chthoniobacteraceae bacterium]
MGLFSFLKPPAPDAWARETAWQRGVFAVEQLSSEAYAVHVPGRAPRIVPAFAVDFALGCAKFRPLAGHVAEYAEKHRWDSMETAALERLLPTLATEGLLVSSDEVRTRLDKMRGTPGTISALGVPTGGRRYELVARALRSFAENCRTHGRTPDFLVADSSADPENTHFLRGRLRELSLERR